MNVAREFYRIFKNHNSENEARASADYPKELVLNWKHKQWDAITKMLNAKKHIIKEHESYLTRELGKHGKTLDWFLEGFESEIKK